MRDYAAAPAEVQRSGGASTPALAVRFVALPNILGNTPHLEGRGDERMSAFCVRREKAALSPSQGDARGGT